MGVIGKIRQAVKREGFPGMLRHALLSLVDYRYILIREKTEALTPMTPSANFDSKDRLARIAVQAHIYFPLLAEEIADTVSRIPYRFDCYISTDTEDKAKYIKQVFEERLQGRRIYIAVFPNRGRDVAPFIAQLKPCIGEYDYICHIHSKYSSHKANGNAWRVFLYEQLLGSREYIAALLDRFELDPQLGLVFPPMFRGMKRFGGWRGNRAQSEALMRRIGLNASLPNRPDFPAGGMFWARANAIAPAFLLDDSDFFDEAGQVEGTPAHCLERCWGCIARARGYGLLRVKAPKQAGRPYAAKQTKKRL